MALVVAAGAVFPVAVGARGDSEIAARNASKMVHPKCTVIQRSAIEKVLGVPIDVSVLTQRGLIAAGGVALWSQACEYTYANTSDEPDNGQINQPAKVIVAGGVSVKLWHDYSSAIKDQFKTTAPCGTFVGIELRCLPARNVRIPGFAYALESPVRYEPPLPTGVPAMHYSVDALSKHHNLIAVQVWGESLEGTEALMRAAVHHDRSF